jgi:DHA2 family multidrug resistance protein
VFIDSRLMVATGFALLSLSAFMFARLTLQISMSDVVLASILNGMSTGMIFVPLSTTTVGRLRNEQMGSATGLYNLMRNLGGSVGISLATTLLARRAQAHHPAYEQARRTLEQALSARGNPMTAARQALGMLYARLVRQATLLAFLDVFRALSVLALLCLPLAFLFARILPRRVRPRPAEDA